MTFNQLNYFTASAVSQYFGGGQAPESSGALTPLISLSRRSSEVFADDAPFLLVPQSPFRQTAFYPFLQAPSGVIQPEEETKGTNNYGLNQTFIFGQYPKSIVCPEEDEAVEDKLTQSQSGNSSNSNYADHQGSLAYMDEEDEVLLNVGRGMNYGQQQILSHNTPISMIPEPFRITPTTKKIHTAKNYDKNICRYLTRRTVRKFGHRDYESVVMELCGNDEELYDDVTAYYARHIERISGFRVLKEYIVPTAEDDERMVTFKSVFKEFTRWFLKNRIVRYILKGEMDDKLSYIRYKNRVMLKYLDRPDAWLSNKGKVTKKIAKKAAK